MAPKKVGEITIPVYEFAEGVPNPPAYKGDGVAIWGSVAKDGRHYLSCRVLGNSVPCFKYEPKEK